LDRFGDPALQKLDLSKLSGDSFHCEIQPNNNRVTH